MMFTEAEMVATIEALTARIVTLERELRDRELHHFETEQALALLTGPGVEVSQVRADGDVLWWRKGVGDVWHRVGRRPGV